MATQNLLRIAELDGLGDLTGLDRSLKSTDDLSIVAQTVTFDGAVDFDGSLTIAAGESITGDGALTLATSTGDLTLESGDGEVIVKLGDASGAQAFRVQDSGGAGEVFKVDSDGNVTIDGNVVIAGGISYSGGATQIQDATLATGDPLFLVNSGFTGAAARDLGWIGERGDDTNVGFIFDESADQFALILTASTGTETGNVTISDYADLRLGGLAVDDTLTVGGGSTFTGAADFDAGLTLAANQSITGDGALSIESGGAGSLNLISASHVNVTLPDADGTSELRIYDSGIQVVASVDSDGAATFASLTLASGGAITGILDDDTFATASAGTVPTSESVKAYVDAQVGGASSLDELSDVTLTDLADGEVLLSSSGTFINRTLAEAGIQAQADVLDDLATLGANSSDGEFLVGTGAGALAWESGATVRASLGLGSSDSPTFAGLDLNGNAVLSATAEIRREGYTAASSGGATNNSLFSMVDEGGAMRAALPDPSSGTGSFAKARVVGVWRTGGLAVRDGHADAVLIEDNVAVAINDPLYASTSAKGRVTVPGGTGMPGAGDYKVLIGYAKEAVASDADQGGGAGTDRVVKVDLLIQPPVQI